MLPASPITMKIPTPTIVPMPNIAAEIVLKAFFAMINPFFVVMFKRS
jgi:hypothetical protein